MYKQTTNLPRIIEFPIASTSSPSSIQAHPYRHTLHYYQWVSWCGPFPNSKQTANSVRKKPQQQTQSICAHLDLLPWLASTALGEKMATPYSLAPFEASISFTGSWR